MKATESLPAAAPAPTFPAFQWLEDSWKLDTSSYTAQNPETALHLHGTTTVVRDRALDLLAYRWPKPPRRRAGRARSTTSSTVPSRRPTSTTARTTTTTPSPRASTRLHRARSRGIRQRRRRRVRRTSMPFRRRSRTCWLSPGTTATLLGSDMTSAFARSLAHANLPTVVAVCVRRRWEQRRRQAPKRGAALASTLDDRAFGKSVSTVDDL